MNRPILLAVLLSLFAATAFPPGEASALSGQPVPFSHKTHVAGNGIDCRFCHIYATRSASAGIPSVAKCMSCHRVVAAGNPSVKLVARAADEKRAIAWNRVAKLPDHVYFPHHKMVNAGVPCLFCHPGVDQAVETVQKRAFTMGWCMACHRQRGVSIDCWTCHK